MLRQLGRLGLRRLSRPGAAEKMERPVRIIIKRFILSRKKLKSGGSIYAS